jgi:adenylate cyclase class 2
MIEVELKAALGEGELERARARVERAEGPLVFAGRLEDRRFDRVDRALAIMDHVLRLRVYREPAPGSVRATLDWKGPTTYDGGYKRREELNTDIGDPDEFARILDRMGFVISMAIDRDIWQFELEGAVVRFERYPKMDDLVEVEGSPDAIERAITVLELPRTSFTAERLPDFVRRFEARTGERAALSDAELAGLVRYDVNNA